MSSRSWSVVFLAIFVSACSVGRVEPEPVVMPKVFYDIYDSDSIEVGVEDSGAVIPEVQEIAVLEEESDTLGQVSLDIEEEATLDLDQTLRLDEDISIAEQLQTGLLAERRIYFALDSFMVADVYRLALAAHANFLIENPNIKVIARGRTDPSGSREYNLALGQKRAEAVKKIWLLFGVPAQQIEVSSIGEEGSSSLKSAYSSDRRVDIVYLGIDGVE